MVKPKIGEILKTVKTAAVQHSPEILTGVGIAGMITTTVLAVRATPTALDLIDEAKKHKGEDKLTPVETVKATWKVYIPAVVTGVASTVCLIGASRVNLKRNAALATAYKLSETALAEYREKVIEVVGENKERQVREAIDKDYVEKHPVSKSTVVITGNGTSLCVDPLAPGRYFESSIDNIKRAESRLNLMLVRNDYASLNDFYDELGVDHTKLGYDLGWKVSDGEVEIDFTTQLSDDGRPCIVINYLTPPKYGYDRFA